MIYKIFDRIAQAITSMGAVVFTQFMIICSMIFFSHTFFVEVFPSNMSTWEKVLATWSMALGWEFTVLITTVNTKHINKNIPLVMAICSGVIVLFFLRAFDGSLTWLELGQRWFVGVLMAYVNYVYAELFFAKWQERQAHQSMPLRLIEFQSMVNDRDRQVNDLQSKLIQAESKINETDAELKELRAMRKRLNEELTCEHCKVVQPSSNVLRAHKGHCSKNPINQK